MHKSSSSLSPVQRYLDELHAELASMTEGAVASYIPELTRADPAWLGISIVTVDGYRYEAGDTRQPFTIQSISKALVYGLALEDRGLDAVLGKVGVEPTGEAFNSISLEPETGRPLNPMINAGAIATTGLIEGADEAARMQRILAAFGRYTGSAVDIDDKVYASESATGHRNRAIAHLLYGHGVLDRAPDEVLDLYFRQCSILVTATDLALMAACLANSGVNPVTGVTALERPYVEKVLSVMSTCGMYDYSGEWVFNVGLPAKSGVGGGIMAVLPGQFGLGVFSPRLDPKGNSVRGIEACKRVSKDFDVHLFSVARSTSATVIRAVYDGSEFRSRRRRVAVEDRHLEAVGARIRIYELRGQLMFGATESVAQQILASMGELDFLVIDLQRVFHVDGAAASILATLTATLLERGKRVVFAGAGSHDRLLSGLEALGTEEPGWCAFDDVDRAVEWCEDRLLGVEHAPVSAAEELDLATHHLCAGLTGEELSVLRDAARRVRFAAGETVFRAADSATSFFFVLDGEVEVIVATGADSRLRVTTIGSGMCFGELAVLTQGTRSADVVASRATLCLEIPFESLDGTLERKLLSNLTAYLARKVVSDTELLQRIA